MGVSKGRLHAIKLVGQAEAPCLERSNLVVEVADLIMAPHHLLPYKRQQGADLWGKEARPIRLLQAQQAHADAGKGGVLERI